MSDRKSEIRRVEFSQDRMNALYGFRAEKNSAVYLKLVTFFVYSGFQAVKTKDSAVKKILNIDNRSDHS